MGKLQTASKPCPKICQQCWQVSAWAELQGRICEESAHDKNTCNPMIVSQHKPAQAQTALTDRQGASHSHRNYFVEHAWHARAGLYRWVLCQDRQAGAAGLPVHAHAVAVLRHQRRVARQALPLPALVCSPSSQAFSQRSCQETYFLTMQKETKLACRAAEALSATWQPTTTKKCST